MKRIGIVCAMEKELALIDKSSERAGTEIRAVLSGIGKVNAALATLKLIYEFQPDFILSAGAAGSLDAACRQGELILGAKVSYHDVWCGKDVGAGIIQGLPAEFPADAELLEKAAAICPEARVGRIITGDQFYLDEAEDRRQKELYPDALAVDMESAAIAQTCFLEKVPFLSLRIISDIHGENQSDSYTSFWNNPAETSFHAVSRIISAI